MTLTIHAAVEQGSDEWLALRCGLLTASEMSHIITPKLKVADNDKSRGHLWEMLAQRISRHVEPAYVSDDMLRGREDEIEARLVYERRYSPVETCGFMVRDFGGFRIGYSPDGLVGDDGLIECKSRRQKYQVQTIVCDAMPDDYAIQVQTGLLVSGRPWCDFISYSGGLPMAVLRVFADTETQDAIVEAASAFERRLNEAWATYKENTKRHGFHMTDRRVEEEMMI